MFLTSQPYFSRTSDVISKLSHTLHRQVSTQYSMPHAKRQLSSPYHPSHVWCKNLPVKTKMSLKLLTATWRHVAHNEARASLPWMTYITTVCCLRQSGNVATSCLATENGGCRALGFSKKNFFQEYLPFETRFRPPNIDDTKVWTPNYLNTG